MTFKSYLTKFSLELMTTNFIVSLHNRAITEDFYGEGMYNALMLVQSQGLITEDDITNLFVLSLEWPYDVQIE